MVARWDSGAKVMRRLLIVVGLLVIVPIIEIAVLIAIGQVIGLGWTLLLMLATSALGAWLLRREGGKAWRAFQVELVALIVVTAAFLIGLDLLDVSSRTPLVWEYFVSQWQVAWENLREAPYLLVNLFWASYNALFLYGLFMFRVDTK